MFRGILVLVFFFLLVSNQSIGQSNDEASGDAQNGITVSEYCDKFARKYFESHPSEYLENSAIAVMESDVIMWFSNIFAPADSKFTSGYDCKFQASNKEGKFQEFSVSLFLTGTLAFAEYTQWEDLQIVPIEYVVDLNNSRIGYGVFKYLETP